MAMRASGIYLRPIKMQQIKSISFSTSTDASTARKTFWTTAAAAPIWMVGGMVIIAGSIGMHTAKLQLMHNPNVHLQKSKREIIPEIEEPSKAIKSGGKFVDKSFLRKAAHIQDDSKNTIPNPVQGNIYTRSREVETLDSIKG